MTDAAAIANAAAARGYAKRERMRQEWPAHAALADWARSGGLEVAAVTVGGKTFGKPLPDAKPDYLPLLTVSEVQAAIDDGRIVARKQRAQSGKRLLRDMASAQEAPIDV